MPLVDIASVAVIFRVGQRVSTVLFRPGNAEIHTVVNERSKCNEVSQAHIEAATNAKTETCCRSILRYKTAERIHLR